MAPLTRAPGASPDTALSRASDSASSAERPAPTVRAPEPQVNASGPTLSSDRFIEREIIGRGGSGLVIRAFDTDILREVAIKVLDEDLLGPSPSTEGDRFGEEARISGQLEHPNIVPVYEFGRDRRGRQFLCMKLVRGETLARALERLDVSRLEPERIADLLQVFTKVCDAVSFAHSRGVLHRDLKPTNVMISDFGQVYVLDWGIARLLSPSLIPPSARGHERPVQMARDPSEPPRADAPGELIGTPCYMAPEQLQGLHERLDERTDVFALGATLYQILTGHPPLAPEGVRAIWMKRNPPPIVHPDEHVPGGRVPAELSRIALKALSFAPAERYATVADLKRDLESFQRGAWNLPRATWRAGETILDEGAPGDAAYIIIEGSCAAFRVDRSDPGGDERAIDLRVMGPGDVFGEAAVFSNQPRTASVRAVTDVVLLVVTGEVLSKALGLNFWMGAFVKALAERFRDVDEKLRAFEVTNRR